MLPTSSKYEDDNDYQTRTNVDKLEKRDKLPRRAKKEIDLSETSEENIKTTSTTTLQSDDWKLVENKSRSPKTPTIKEIRARSNSRLESSELINSTLTSNSFDALSSISEESDGEENAFIDASDNVQRSEDNNIITRDDVERSETHNIGINDPLILENDYHPTSTMAKKGIVKFNCPILDNENFSSWKLLMEFSLVQNELWVDPETSIETVEASAELKFKNTRAAMFMAGYIDPKILMLLEFPRCFIRSWSRIHDLFVGINQEDIAMLYGQIMRLRPSPDRSIHDHITDFETIFSKLRERGQPVEENMQVIYLLGSLSTDPLYSEVSRTAKWHNPEKLPFKKVRTILLDTYHQVQLQQDREKTSAMKAVSPDDCSSSGLKASRVGGGIKSSPFNSKVTKFCTFCNRQGHLIERCWLKKKKTAKVALDESSQQTSFANAFKVSSIRSRLGRAVNINPSNGTKIFRPSGSNDDCSDSRFKHNSDDDVIKLYADGEKRIRFNEISSNNKFPHLQKTKHGLKLTCVIEPLKPNLSHFNNLLNFKACTGCNIFYDGLNDFTSTIVEINSCEIASVCSSSGVRPNWIIDSGASIHMCNDRSLFTTFSSTAGRNVRIANGDKIPIIGYGNVVIKLSTQPKVVSLSLNNVAFVPLLDVNLLSVRCMSLDFKEVSFTEKGCFLKLNTSELVQIGKLEGCQYELHEHIVDNEANLCIHDWHKRLAHRNLDTIKRLKQFGLQISKCNCSDDCEGCLKGKLTTLPFPTSLDKPSKALELVVSDVCGPINPKSLGGASYFLTMIDVYSDYTEVFMLNKKSDAKSHIINYITKMKNLVNKKPKIFRSDRGGEYMDSELQQFLVSEGIQYQCTVHDSPQQNGIAERKNRTLVEAVRSMLHQRKIQKNLWAEALHNAVYTFNRIPKLDFKFVPIEVFFNKQFNGTFREFGCKVFYSTNPNGRKKLDAKATEGIFMGVDSASKGFRIFTGNKIRIERNVHFLSCVKPQINNPMFSLDNEILFESPMKDIVSPPEDSIERLKDSDSSTDDLVPRRSPRLALKYQANLANDDPFYEPTTYNQAINCKNKNQWLIAMEDELNSIEQNKTWSLVDIPPGCNAIGSRWVFGLKRDEKGEVVRFKARVVAKGFTQKFGVDYDEVFAPVARPATFRTLLALSSYRNLVVKQFDVKTAFLNGVLENVIYMKPPPGSIADKDKDKVFKLHKTLYGLKQAARSWNKTLHDALIKIDFRQSKYDNCLYVMHNGTETCYVIIHVDDMLFAATSNVIIKSITDSLNKSFELKCLGNVQQFLGIQVTKHSDGSFMVNQSLYINKIAHEFKLEDCRHSKYPLHPGYHKLVGGQLLETNNDYRKLIGMLLYVSTNTRPDIAASVAILAQRVSKPRDLDFVETLRIVRYLVSTKNHVLKLFNPSTKISLEAYSDSDFAEDKTDRKSISGFLCCVLGAPVSWSSRKQDVVSTSTTEAEFYALAEATKEILWLKGLLADFNLETPPSISIHSDNKSTIAMVENEKFSSRTKHIDVRLHFVRDLVYLKEISLKYVPTNINPADMFTKPLAGTVIERLRELVQVSEPH